MAQPAGGPARRTYDYRSGSLFGQGLTMLFFSVVWFSCLGVMVFVAGPASAGSTGAAYPPWEILPTTLFALIGVGLTVVGARSVLVSRNETICVEGDRVVWTRWNGETALSFTLDQVQDIEENQATTANSGMQLKCEVTTRAGKLIFTNELSEYSSLVGVLLPLKPAPPTSGTFRYASKQMLVIPLVFISGVLFVSGGILRDCLAGQTRPRIDSDPTPIYEPVLLSLTALPFCVVLGRFGLRNRNEHIVISPNRVWSYDWRGRKAVDVDLAEVVHLSFGRRRSWNSAYNYAVKTAKGTIRWSDDISRCTDLRFLLCRAAGQDPTDPNVPKMRDAPWNPGSNHP